MTNGLTFGVALPLDRPLDELMATARQAEQLGYGVVWANDDRLQKDVFAALAAIAGCTERVRLGPGVTNPYSRHPALIATAAATVDELSGGRAVLGLGAGGTNHRALGVDRVAPVVALREAIEVIRGLIAGREMTLDGRVVRARDAKLDFKPLRASIPIFVGARGPKMLELAGELADGVIVGNIAGVDGWRYAVGRVAAGAERVGRDIAEIELTAWVYCCLADDSSAALDAVRPMVATSLTTSRPILPYLGLELPAAFAERMEQLGWSLNREAVGDAGRTVPEDVLHWFALAGTPAECGARLHALLAAFPQIAQVTIVPAAIRGELPSDVVRRFIEEVAPAAFSEVVTSAG